MAIFIAIVAVFDFVWLRQELSTPTMFAKIFAVAVLATVVFQIIAYILLGYLDPFSGIAFMIQLVLASGVGLLILTVFYVRRG